MPKSETNSSTIANVFLSKKFEGDKARFQLFEAEVKMALLSEIGEYGVTFLTTEWPIDPDSNKPVYDHRYTMRPQLELLEGGNAETRRERRENIAYNEKLNEKIENCKRICTKVISDRVTSALNQHLLLLDGEAYLFWRYLKRTYGDQLITAQGIGSIFINFIAMNMDHDQRFNEFILEFERTANLIKLPDNIKLGLLLTDGDNKMKIRMLPDRLQKAVERCKLDSKSYYDSKVYLMEKDDLMHSEGLRKRNNDKSIKIINDKQCFNCNNFLHMAHECLLNACGICQKFNCGHKANECRNSTSQPSSFPGPNSGRGAGRGNANRGRGTSGAGRGTNRSRKYINNNNNNNNNNNFTNSSNIRNKFVPNDNYSDNNHFSNNNYNNNNMSNSQDKNNNNRFKQNNNNKNSYSNNNNNNNNNNRNNNNKRQRQITSFENDDENDDNNDDTEYENNAFNQWNNNINDDNYNFNCNDNEDDDDDDYDEGFYDGMNDYPIRQRIIKRVDENKVFTKPLLKRVSVLKSLKNDSNQPIIMLADSGAQEFCVMEKDYLVKDIENYDDNYKPNVNLAGAGGDILPISAKGKINDVIDEVYVCEKLDTNILSTNKLREQGYWFIQPPTSISPDHAGYFFDSTGQLSLICNQNLLTDVSKMDTYDYSIKLPDVSNLNNNISNIYNIYGKGKMTIPETIEFLSKSFLLSVNDLSFLTICMDNFPANSSQIRKYYKTPTCMIRGNLQARNKSQRYFETSEENEKHYTDTKINNPYKDLEYRNINIGTIVGTDVFGPVSNKCASLFVDKASGFVKSTFYKWSIRKQITEKELDTAKNTEIYKSIEWCINIYKLYGHKISTK